MLWHQLALEAAHSLALLSLFALKGRFWVGHNMGHRKLPKNKYLLPAEIVSTLLCVFLCLIVPLYKIVNDAVDLLWKNIDGC